MWIYVNQFTSICQTLGICEHSVDSGICIHNAMAWNRNLTEPMAIQKNYNIIL